MKAEGGMCGVGTKTDDDLPNRNDMQMSFFEKQTCFFANYIHQIEKEVMESLGVDDLLDKNRGESGEMIGNQNKKLQVKNEGKEMAPAEDLPINKNDVSIM
jgi:hypothetical protein